MYIILTIAMNNFFPFLLSFCFKALFNLNMARIVNDQHNSSWRYFYYYLFFKRFCFFLPQNYNQTIYHTLTEPLPSS